MTSSILQQFIEQTPTLDFIHDSRIPIVLAKMRSMMSSGSTSYPNFPSCACGGENLE